MKPLDEMMYEFLFEMSEQAIELGRLYLKDNKRAFSEFRELVVLKTHLQKRRARKGIYDNFYSDKYSFLKGVLEQNRYNLMTLWTMFVPYLKAENSNELNERVKSLIEDSFNIQVSRLGKVLGKGEIK